jgi:hypothetical protein
LVPSNAIHDEEIPVQSERCSPALFLVALAAGGRGTAAIRVIRGAVGEIETIWAEQSAQTLLNYAACCSSSTS